MESAIFTAYGRRKYLTSHEMECFAKTSKSLPLGDKCFCLTTAYTGCRISEVLSLTAQSIDFEAQALIVKCLKKRGRTVYRAIPLPVALLDMLRRLTDQASGRDERLWPWSRMTGYRRIREVMDRAGIVGEHASPKGLRHGFAVQAIQANVPLTLVQRWLGHADLKTTAIYTSAMGAEERKLAARMWQEAKDPATRSEALEQPPAKALRIKRIAAFADAAVAIGCDTCPRSVPEIPPCEPAHPRKWRAHTIAVTYPEKGFREIYSLARCYTIGYSVTLKYVNFLALSGVACG